MGVHSVFWYVPDAVGVPADASAVVSVTTIAGIPALACISAIASLPSAVYVFDVPLSLLQACGPPECCQF
jgi:hypothetical protein